MSLLCLTLWVLLIPRFFCSTVTCPSPDFPERGTYEPIKAKYEVGSKILYACKGEKPVFVESNWIGFFKVATCTSSGEWSIGTPFCDMPIQIQLRNTTLSVEEYSKDFASDMNPRSCFRIQNGSEEFLVYSLGRIAVVYTTMICWWKGASYFKIKVSESLTTTMYDGFGFQGHGCKIANHYNKDQETQNITVQVSPNDDSSILLCEILVFAKTDEWCLHPPENSDPNGQLEVGRIKAVLHCKEGFKEKDGKETYATCHNNTWSYWNLQCVEKNDNSCNSVVGNVSPEEGEWDDDRNARKYKVGSERTLKCRPGYYSEGTPLTVTCHTNGSWTWTTAACKKATDESDSDIIAIIVGSVIGTVILILVGLAIFLVLTKKRTFSMFKPGNRNTNCTLSVPGGIRTTDI